MAASRPDRLVVSPAAVVRFVDGRLEIVARNRLSAGRDALAILAAFATPATIAAAVATSGLPSEDALACIDTLASAGALVAAGAVAPGDPFGRASYAISRENAGMIHSSETTADSTARRPLPPRAPTQPELCLAARRSRRHWSRTPLPQQTLGALLGVSLAPDPSGQFPYPSGGALYSIHCLVAVGDDAIEELPSGIYRYGRVRHDLGIAGDATEAAAWLAGAGISMDCAPPPACLAFASHLFTVERHYQARAYSLVLREAGAMVQTVQLVAGALGIATCPLMCAVPERTGAAAKEFVVAEMALGASNQRDACP